MAEATRFSDQVPERALTLHLIDIGQGDGLLVTTPEGRAVLIDSGPPGGRKALLAYLTELGLEHLELVVSSHPHADHIGNMPAVLDRFAVGLFLDSGFVHPTAVFEQMLNRIEAKKIPLSLARSDSGAAECLLGGPPQRRCRSVTVEPGVVFEVLAPHEPMVSGSRSDANANSVVLRLQYGEVSFLFTGDAEEETEDRLLRGHRDRLRATVLKVAHHGSRHATRESFLRAVSPELAVISAAKKNRYGHPAPETLSRLSAAGVPALSTSEVGDIQVHTDGKGLVVQTRAPGGEWLAFSPSTRARRAPVEESRDAGGTERAAVDAGDTGDVDGGGPDSSEAGDGLIDLNAATADELTQLPGIGKSIAARIVEHREANGAFKRVDDLKNVSGIGAKKLEAVRGLVKVTTTE